MMIAPGGAGSELGTIQPQTSVHRARRVAGLYAQGETDTERTQRTKHGPLGCRGKSSAAGQQKAIAFTKHTPPERPPASALPLVCSRAVRALSAVSALCPFLPERRDQPRAKSSGPTFGIGSLRASGPPRPVQSSFGRY